MHILVGKGCQSMTVLRGAHFVWVSKTTSAWLWFCRELILGVAGHLYMTGVLGELMFCEVATNVWMWFLDSWWVVLMEEAVNVWLVLEGGTRRVGEAQSVWLGFLCELLYRGGVHQWITVVLEGAYAGWSVGSTSVWQVLVGTRVGRERPPFQYLPSKFG